jgi:uncharacterized membrane protein
MPDIGPFHPQIVHFVVAMGLVGVALRIVSLTGRLAWTRPSATLLLLVAAVASVGAVMSGQDAHGPVERVPGVREAVQEHEQLGEKTRNLFLLVAAFEVAALALRKREKVQRGLLIASALAGIAASGMLYEAAEHGGSLVYSYAGGVGLRTGDPQDIHRLLVAGLYQESRTARDSGRTDEAARLTDELVRQVPNDPAVTLLSIESILKDRKDPKAALAALAGLQVPENNPRFAMQKGMLQSQAYEAAGQRDSARAVLEDLAKKYPRAQRFVAEALAKLQ